MTPAVPSPVCLFYTITETTGVSSGAILSLDDVNNPTIINIPALTGIAAGTYTFQIVVTSENTIQTSYILEITIVDCSTATVTVPT